MQHMEQELYHNYRLLLESTRTFDVTASALLSGLSSMGMVTDRPKPIIDIYAITERRHKIAEGHKIGLVGNPNNFTPDESFYLGDLRTLLKNSKNPLVGVYMAYEFWMDSKPRLLDLIVTTVEEGEHKLQEVWQVTKIRKGVMAFLFDDYQLTEINGTRKMNLMDFKTTGKMKVEILKEASLACLN